MTGNKMRLLLDGQCLQTASRVRGIGRYARELIGALYQRKEIQIIISLNVKLGDEALLAQKMIEQSFPKAQIVVWQGLADTGEAISGFSKERQLSEAVFAHHVNMIAPDFALSLSPFEGSHDPAVPLLPHPLLQVPLASVFYDAIPYVYPETYLPEASSKRYYERRLFAYKDFDANFCISNFSMEQLEGVHGDDLAGPCVNIGAGLSAEFKSILKKKGLATSSKRNVKDTVFDILYVGSVDWRKNIFLVIDAIALLPKALQKSIRFTLAGSINLSEQGALEHAWRSHGLAEDSILFGGIVSDEELVDLYRTSSLLVQPSLMEGFGLTALEALLSGCAVAVSTAGALPEVVNQSVLGFDPTDPKDLARLLTRMMRNPTQFTKPLKAARTNAELMTWQHAAKLVVQTLMTWGQCDEKQVERLSLRPLMMKYLQSLKPLDHKQRELLVHALAVAERSKTEFLDAEKGNPGRLLIDTTYTVKSQLRTGIQRVVRQLTDEMLAKETVNAHPVFCVGVDGMHVLDSLNCTTEMAMASPIAGVNANDTLLMLDSSWDMIGSHSAAMAEHRLLGNSVVLCVYDLTPLLTPAFCGSAMPDIFKRWLFEGLVRCTGVVCISKAVADQLYSLLKAIEYPHKVEIGHWPLGANLPTAAKKSKNQSLSKAVKNKRSAQFLMVGTIEPRKGYEVSLDAFDVLWGDGIEVRLEIIGKPGWNTDALQKRIQNHPEFGKALTWHAQADDTFLSDAYARCDALIAASYAEGFGLPIVEGGFFGKPVIASDIPVFREVAEGAGGAIFFETGDSRSLAESILAVTQGGHPVASQVKSWPDWKESAEKLHHVISGNWYRTFKPSAREVPMFIDEIGRVGMGGPLDMKTSNGGVRGGSLCKLTSLGEPVVDEASNMVSFTAQVKNISKQNWSSMGQNGLYIVNLGARCVDRKTGQISDDAQRAQIPLIIEKNTSLLMRVDCPRHWLREGRDVHLQLVQEGVCWFGKPLIFPFEKTWLI